MINRHSFKRNQPRRPANLTLRLQQSWRKDGQKTPPDPGKDQPAPRRAA